MDIEGFHASLEAELRQMEDQSKLPVNPKDLEDLRMSLVQLYIEMLIYVSNAKWQSEDNVRNIALYSNNLSSVYNRLGYSSTNKIDLDQVYSGAIQLLSARFYSMAFPDSRPEDWDIPNLTSREFIRDFIHKNAQTFEVKAFLSSRDEN